MHTPGALAMPADRYTAMIRTLAFYGLNLTGATFALQVRDRKDGGTLRADLETVASASLEGVRLIYGGTDTVANHIAAGRIGEAPDGYDSDDNLILTLVGIRIDEATMEAMPFDTPRGGDVELWWDLHVTPSGSDKEVYAAGVFTVRAGATE